MYMFFWESLRFNGNDLLLSMSHHVCTCILLYLCQRSVTFPTPSIITLLVFSLLIPLHVVNLISACFGCTGAFLHCCLRVMQDLKLDAGSHALMAEPSRIRVWQTWGFM